MAVEQRPSSRRIRTPAVAAQRVGAWSATFRSLQRGNSGGCWKISARAGVREMKRRERRAPVLERNLQVASARDWRRRWRISACAGRREVKRRKRRAPAAERDLQVASTCEWTKGAGNPLCVPAGVRRSGVNAAPRRIGCNAFSVENIGGT